MSPEYFIAKKITKEEKGNRQLSRPIVKIATGGIILGMTVMILTIFIVKGFQKEVRSRTFAFGGHIQVQKFNNNSQEPEPIDADQSFLKELKTDERIRHIQSFAAKSGIIKTKKENEGVLLKGVGKDYEWGFIGDHMTAGKCFDPAGNFEKPPVLISKYLSDRLGLVSGDKMFIYFLVVKTTREAREQSGDEQSNDSLSKVKPSLKNIAETEDEDSVDVTTYEQKVQDFVISGIYETGLEEFDKKIVFSTQQVIAKVNGWPTGKTGGFEIWLNNLRDLDESEENPLLLQLRYILSEKLNFKLEPKEYLAEKVYNLTPSEISSQTIKQANPAIFEWLDMHDTTAWIVLILMIVVSVINMVSALIILILEKTNMIGILKAVGMENKKVKRIFLYQASMLIGKGMLWGNLCGIALAAIQYHFHLAKLDQSTYYISFVPVSFEWTYLLLLNIGTFAACMLCMLLPVMIITRTTPIRAIRFN